MGHLMSRRGLLLPLETDTRPVGVIFILAAFCLVYLGKRIARS